MWEKVSVQAGCELNVCQSSFCTLFYILLTGKISVNPCYFFPPLFFFLSWQLRLVLCVSSFPLIADDVTLRAGEGGRPPSLSTSSLYLHLHFPPSSSSLLLPRPPSFLDAMAHTNHFICRLLDFPDAARLQPPSHADPAFYFAHTERISGIKWPLVSADALFFIFIFLLARFCRKILDALKLALHPPKPPADAELRGRMGWT